MKQYSAEAGLNLNNKITFAAQVLPGKDEAPVLFSEEMVEKICKITASQEKQLDLYYFKSILTSIGLNKNDDYFEVSETWAARHSPEDKQINYEHNEREIIGHMTGCYAASGDLSTVLDDSLTIDELPAKFHIVSAGVLYNRWEDEKLQARMNEIIADIAKGEMFVSMECLFSDFDYVLINENDGTQEIVSRGKETAFLTRYLRGFGGTGVYNSRRIGRLLKNIVFSGKGMVKRPANPESIILTQASDNKIGDIANMSKEITTTATELQLPNVDELNSGVKALKAALDAEKQEKEAAKAQAAKDAQAKAQKEFDDLKVALATKETEIQTLKDQVAKSDEALKVAQTEIETVKASAKAAQDELAKIAADQKVQKRIARLKDNGYSEDEAVALEKKFASVDDATFEAIAEMSKKDKKKDEMKHNCADELYAKEDKDNEAGADPKILATLAAKAGIANVVKNVDPEGTLLEQFTKSTAREMRLCQKFFSNKE